MIRTCLKMQMLCHYAANEPLHAHSPAVIEQRKELIKEGMLQAVDGETGYIVTEKARCYLNYIFHNLEYPKPSWSMN